MKELPCAVGVCGSGFVNRGAVLGFCGGEDAG